jgi:hypothetical protein
VSDGLQPAGICEGTNKKGGPYEMKRKMVFIMIVAFILMSAPSLFAAYEFYLGAITKIDGNSITIKNDAGKLRTLQWGIQPPQGLKVGDKINVKIDSDKILSWSWGMTKPKVAPTAVPKRTRPTN